MELEPATGCLSASRPLGCDKMPVLGLQTCAFKERLLEPLAPRRNNSLSITITQADNFEQKRLMLPIILKIIVVIYVALRQI